MKKNFKKLSVAAVIFALFTAVMSFQIFASTDVITVFVDGEQINFDVDPVTENDRTLVPMRAIFEALGATVTWDETTQTAIAVKDVNTIKITIDSNIMYKNEESIILDVPARMIEDRTLVPIRAVSESLDAAVDWIEETQQVIITGTAPVPTAIISENTPSPIPEPTAVAVTKPTPGTSTEGSIKASELTDSDMKKLKDSAENLRYSYEQTLLPYLLYNTNNFYNYLNEKPEELKNTIKNEWYLAVERAILNIQLESESTYIIDNTFLEDAPDLDVMYNAYKNIITKADLDFEDIVEEIKIESINNSTKAAVIIFKDADSTYSIECKCVALTADSSDNRQCYTMEGDFLTTDSWFFCFINTNSRGTIGYFTKVSDSKDYSAFIAMIKFAVGKEFN